MLLTTHATDGDELSIHRPKLALSRLIRVSAMHIWVCITKYIVLTAISAPFRGIDSKVKCLFYKISCRMMQTLNLHFSNCIRLFGKWSQRKSSIIKPITIDEHSYFSVSYEYIWLIGQHSHLSPLQHSSDVLQMAYLHTCLYTFAEPGIENTIICVKSYQWIYLRKSYL